MVISTMPEALHKDVNNFGIEMIMGEMSTLTLKPNILENMKNNLELDLSLVRIRKEVIDEKIRNSAFLKKTYSTIGVGNAFPRTSKSRNRFYQKLMKRIIMYILE